MLKKVMVTLMMVLVLSGFVGTKVEASDWTQAEYKTMLDEIGVVNYIDESGILRVHGAEMFNDTQGVYMDVRMDSDGNMSLHNVRTFGYTFR